MKRKILTALIVFSMAAVFIQPAFAWLIYSKPEFNGRVIDAESKQPISGAVVVVLYEKWNFGGSGGGNTLPFYTKETLTDHKGEFHFPSYKTLIGPLSQVEYTAFIIYKPGYLCVKRIDEINRIPDENYFSIKKDKVGKEGEIQFANPYSNDGEIFTWKGPIGIVALKRAKTREERLRTMPDRPTGYTSKELPILIKIINEERKNLGLKGEIS